MFVFLVYHTMQCQPTKPIKIFRLSVKRREGEEGGESRGRQSRGRASCVIINTTLFVDIMDC